jgi:hypothetical protein
LSKKLSKICPKFVKNLSNFLSHLVKNQTKVNCKEKKNWKKKIGGRRIGRRRLVVEKCNGAKVNKN